MQKFTSYIAGWLLTLSWLCGVTSGMFLTGQMAQAAIIITSDSYAAPAYQCWLLVFAFAGLGLLLNTVAAKHLAMLEVFVAAFFVLGYAANIIVLWVMAPKNSASDVFGGFDNGNGWSSTGFGILTAQTAALYLIIGSDGAAHMVRMCSGKEPRFATAADLSAFARPKRLKMPPSMSRAASSAPT